MASGNGRLVSSSPPPSSMKLLLFMIPLIVVSGCAAVVGSGNSVWGFIPRYPWLWRSPDTASVGGLRTPQVSAAKQTEALLGLHSTVVVGVHHREEAISDDSVFNRSSSPPLDVEAAQPPLAAPVKLQPFSVFILIYFFVFILLLSSALKDYPFADH